MEISRQSVEIFMVSSFLIKNHNYKFVAVNQKQNEFWLANPSNMEFPVIRVSFTSAESVYFEKERLLRVHNSILMSIKREGRLLDLHVSDETEVETDVNFEQAVLNNGVIYGKNISHYFPLIKNAITRFDNPKEEIARLTRELENYQTSHKKQKANVKKMKSKMLNSTSIVIGICIIMYLLIQFLSLSYDGSISPAIALGAYFKPMIVVNHQYWRFLTVGFMHIDLIHLMMNMFSLYMLGPIVESTFGKKGFIIILLVSILTGSICVFLFSNTTVLVGISGGLYGCLGAYFVYAYTQGLFNNPMFKSSIMRLVMINLIINLSPSVSVLGHVGGLVGGVLVSILLLKYKPWEMIKKNCIVASIVLAIFCGYRIMMENDIENLYLANYSEVFEMYDSIGLGWFVDSMTDDIEEYLLD